MTQMNISPGDIDFGPCEVSFKGASLGASKGGVTARYEPTFYDIKPDQLMTPLDVRLTGEAFVVTVPMLETSIAKLATVMPSGTKTEQGTKIKLEFGGGQVSAADAGELVLTPLADGSLTLSEDANKKITVWKAFPRPQFNMSYNLEGERVVPVEFHAMADVSKPAGKMLYALGDTTATA